MPALRYWFGVRVHCRPASSSNIYMMQAQPIKALCLHQDHASASTAYAACQPQPPECHTFNRIPNNCNETMWPGYNCAVPAPEYSCNQCACRFTCSCRKPHKAAITHACQKPGRMQHLHAGNTADTSITRADAVMYSIVGPSSTRGMQQGDI